MLGFFRKRKAAALAKRKKRGAKTKQPVTHRLPAGTRVYAVGDIHGRADLLGGLHRRITKDDAAAPPAGRKILVYLGDYVDRGAMVRQVLDQLLAGPPEGFEAVYLRGNHEELLLDSLANPATLATWLPLGGQATLLNYQVAAPAQGFSATRARETRDAFNEALPSAHLEFLHHLQDSFRLGDYFFTHAGVRPGVSLERQSPQDLLWIRDEFLASSDNFSARVVHGHSIHTEPQIMPNRIGLDTGAYATGVLTCAVLEDDKVRLLPPPEPER